MEKNILVRAIGQFEVYEFMKSISEFEEFYNANTDNFDIFEIANLSDVETTEINQEFTLYDLTLSNTEEHFWLIKDENTGVYEPIDDREQAENIIKHLQAEDDK